MVVPCSLILDPRFPVHGTRILIYPRILDAHYYSRSIESDPLGWVYRNLLYVGSLEGGWGMRDTGIFFFCAKPASNIRDQCYYLRYVMWNINVTF